MSRFVGLSEDGKVYLTLHMTEDERLARWAAAQVANAIGGGFIVDVAEAENACRFWSVRVEAEDGIVDKETATWAEAVTWAVCSLMQTSGFQHP